MKRMVTILVSLSLVTLMIFPTQNTVKAVNISKLPLRERVLCVQNGELDSFSEELEAKRQEKIQQLIDNYKRVGIEYTETDIEKIMGELETAFSIASGIFACIPAVGEITKEAMDLGASITGGMKKSEADKVKDMLQQMMDRIDTRFDIIDEKLNALSDEFSNLKETNKYYELMSVYKTDLSDFRNQFERSQPTDCAYYNYSDWKEKLRNAFSKVQECYSNPDKMVYLNERYEKLYLCAKEVTALYSHIFENINDTSDYSVAKGYYDYLILAGATGVLGCMNQEEITWETVCYINDLYNTYVLAQYSLGISYVHRAEMLDGNATEGDFIHSEYKEIGRDTIITFFEECAGNLDAVKYELTEDLVYVMGVDLSYTYAFDENNAASYIAVPYYYVYDANTDNEKTVIYNQVRKGATVFMNKLPLALNNIYDDSSITYKIVKGSELAVVDNNGKVSITGEYGEFSVAMLYGEKIVYSLTFEITSSLFSGGYGTEEFPYLIATNEDLSNIREFSDKHFVLVNDIDLSAEETTYISDNNYYNFVTIPEFSGVLNGKGHTISGMKHRLVADNVSSAREFYLGLFGINSGTIKNIHIEKFDLFQEHSEVNKNPSAYTGFLCGKNAETGLIEHITAEDSEIYHWVGYDVDIWPEMFAGGICGWNHGTIRKCGVVDTNIQAKSKTKGKTSLTYVGGIAGINFSDVEDCFAAYNNLLSGAYCGSTNGWFSWSGIAYARVGGLVGTVENGGSLLRCLVVDNIYDALVDGGWKDGSHQYANKGVIYALAVANPPLKDLYEYKYENSSMMPSTPEETLPYYGLDISQYQPLVDNDWMQKENGEPSFKKSEGDTPSYLQIYTPKEIESSKIVIDAIPVYEYAISECGGKMSEWKKKPEFSNLMPGTPYRIYVRTAENNVASASGGISVMTIFTKKENAGIPVKPVEVSKTTDKIIVKKVDGYEYSIDGLLWQESNEFDNLEENTEYILYQRIAETNSTYASEKSEGIMVKTERVIKSTFVSVENNPTDNTCIVDVEITEDDLSEKPILYVAFYDNEGVLVSVEEKDVLKNVKQYVVDIPEKSSECRVFLWRIGTLVPICSADHCRV